MSIRLVDYQSVVVERLVDGFKALIASSNDNTQVVLKSPTGSGKTVMVASMLDALLNEELPSECVYIWASMNDLHRQSMDKLNKQYLPDSAYNMIALEEMTDDALDANTILFCNWESMFQIKKKTGDDGVEIDVFKNVYVRLGETGRNLQNVLERTRAEGRRIVLIVDEAHKTYLGKNSQKLIEQVIKPALTIEVSATPLLKPSAEDVEENRGRHISVKIEDVIASGLIKNRTIINNDIAGVVDKASADTAVIEAALRQREVLAEKYREQGTDVKPLILIQLPSETVATGETDETVRGVVEKFLHSRGVTYENNKLAIWLSGDKTNRDLVDIPDSPVEVLIFKQAIATGWDCPRAQILVMLRDIKSITFEIQTVGRILRMPELKHYEDEALNAAYVFTNISRLDISGEGDAQVFFRIQKSRLVNGFDNILLPDSSQSIRRDRRRLGGNFRRILLRKLNQHFEIADGDDAKAYHKKLDNKLQIANKELSVPILADVVIENLDVIDRETFAGANKVSVEADAPYIQRTFNALLRAWVSPYATADSVDILRPAIYKFFSDCGIDDEAEVQRILTCSATNQDQLTLVIADAKNEFGKRGGETREFSTHDFRIPAESEFGESYEEVRADKHALQPYFRSKKPSDPEVSFEAALEKSPNVTWWYRNGESEPKYFSVKYQMADQRTGFVEDHGFYPDYIVQFGDGRIGIFDTKSGSLAVSEETALKLDALRDYIAAHQSQNLFGGIIDVRDAGQSFWLRQSSGDEFEIFSPDTRVGG